MMFRLRSNRLFIVLQFLVTSLIGWTIVSASPGSSVRRIEAQHELRVIINTSFEFAQGNGGSCPDRLADIVHLFDDPHQFLIPRSKRKFGNRKDVDKWSDYAIVSGVKLSDPPETVLVYTKPDCYGGDGGFLGYVSGTVYWFDSKEYEDALKKIGILKTAVGSQ